MRTNFSPTERFKEYYEAVTNNTYKTESKSIGLLEKIAAFCLSHFCSENNPRGFVANLTNPLRYSISYLCCETLKSTGLLKRIKKTASKVLDPSNNQEEIEKANNVVQENQNVAYKLLYQKLSAEMENGTKNSTASNGGEVFLEHEKDGKLTISKKTSNKEFRVTISQDGKATYNFIHRLTSDMFKAKKHYNLECSDEEIRNKKYKEKLEKSIKFEYKITDIDRDFHIANSVKDIEQAISTINSLQ